MCATSGIFRGSPVQTLPLTIAVTAPRAGPTRVRLRGWPHTSNSSPRTNERSTGASVWTIPSAKCVESHEKQYFGVTRNCPASRAFAGSLGQTPIPAGSVRCLAVDEQRQVGVDVQAELLVALAPDPVDRLRPPGDRVGGRERRGGRDREAPRARTSPDRARASAGRAWRVARAALPPRAEAADETTARATASTTRRVTEPL